MSRIPERILQMCANEENQLFMSAVSAWEIAAKHQAGKLPLPVTPSEYVKGCRAANKIMTIRFREDDAFQLYKLPGLHKDPFDRMLICQAITRGLTILTPDEHITQYPIATTW